MVYGIIFIYIYPMTIVLIWVYLLFTVPVMFIDSESELVCWLFMVQAKATTTAMVVESAVSQGNDTNKEHSAELQN
jgi:hypothetical protein